MSPDPDDTFRLVGSVVAERYAVERVVARGGFGLVYKAAHVELGSPIALKVLVIPEHLRGSADAALVERFRLEARTLAALKHPAIVRVLDVGSLDPADPAPGAGPCVWMALEWIEGATLDDDLRARAGRGRPPLEALALLAPVLEAVASAHARGIAHRDLKPANIMISPAARGGVEARVLDFGIAKVMHPDERPGSGNTETQSDLSAFSLQHAAPEQVGRARTGPWTDVHALGLLVTELLLGRRAYQGAESFTLYGAVMSPDRPTPARHGVGVGPWEPVLARALALHAGDRFAGAGELHAALSACVDEAQRAWERPLSIDTAPVFTARTRPRAPGRAQRAAVGVAAALAVSALVAVGGRLTHDPPARRASPAPVAPPAVVAPVVASLTAVAAVVAVVAPVARAVDAGVRALPAVRRPAAARPRPPPDVGDTDPEVVIE